MDLYWLCDNHIKPSMSFPLPPPGLQSVDLDKTEVSVCVLHASAFLILILLYFHPSPMPPNRDHAGGVHTAPPGGQARTAVRDCRLGLPGPGPALS